MRLQQNARSVSAKDALGDATQLKGTEANAYRPAGRALRGFSARRKNDVFVLCHLISSHLRVREGSDGKKRQRRANIHRPSEASWMHSAVPQSYASLGQCRVYLYRASRCDCSRHGVLVPALWQATRQAGQRARECCGARNSALEAAHRASVESTHVAVRRGPVRRRIRTCTWRCQTPPASG